MESENLLKMQDSKYFYSKTYPIRYSEIDFREVLKPYALLNFLQDMATENAEMLGFGPSFVFPKNYAWFLIKYHMEFDEYPCSLPEIVVHTEARGYSKILASRDFEIYTTDNKRLGRVSSNWMLLDLNTKSILPLAKTIDFMPNFQKRPNDLSYEKIKSLERVDFEKTFEIRFVDIDVNQHVNNANYIIWAFEALPYEFNATHKLKTLDIAYKKEIAHGNSVISQVQLNDNVSTHVLKNAETGEELCFVQAIWE